MSLSSHRITDFFPSRKRKRTQSLDRSTWQRSFDMRRTSRYGKSRSRKYGKGKLRYARRGKSVRRPVRKSRVRRRNAGLTRKKLLNMLTVPNYWSAQSAFQIKVPVPGATGKTVSYNTNAYSMPRITDLVEIATAIEPNPTSTNLKLTFTQLLLRYEYSNMDITSTYLTAYFCRARRDVPDTLNYFSPVQIMEDGWADNNYSVGSRGVLGFDELNLDPFKSFKFCHYFNIYKVKKLKLQGGESGKLAVKCKSRVLNMADAFTKSGGDQATWSAYSKLWSHVKGSKFILFRVEGEIGNQETTKTNITATAPRVNFITSYNYTYKRISESRSDLIVGPVAGFTGGAAEQVTEQGQQDVVP